MYDIIIIGAGISGTTIARELSRYDLDVLVLDKDNDISNGTTKANTALVHAGYDAPIGSDMAKFNVEGSAIYEALCKELDVPYERVGSLVIGFNEEDKETIKSLYEQGVENGVPEMSIIDRDEILKLQPNISDKACTALYAKTAAIVGPWELAVALMENAMDNGVELKLNTEVLDITKQEEIFTLNTNNGEFQSKMVINAAGLFADEISHMISKEDFTIDPVKGEYYLLDKSVGDLANMTLFQCPSPSGKGVVVAPTTHGNILIGPNSELIDNKEDLTTTYDYLDFVKEQAKITIKDIPFDKTITTFSGLRASSSTGDFVIGETEDVKGFINVAGIKSPGLSAAPAVALHVKEIVLDILEDVELNKSFIPIRKQQIKFAELSDEEKSELIKKDSKYGHVICRCETITEGEIVDSIHRNAGATTVDGVKRRVRAGMGRCQGGFCLPKVIEILARELDEDMTDIVKDSPDSYILTEKTK